MRKFESLMDWAGLADWKEYPVRFRISDVCLNIQTSIHKGIVANIFWGLVHTERELTCALEGPLHTSDSRFSCVYSAPRPIESRLTFRCVRWTLKLSLGKSLDHQLSIDWSRFCGQRLLTITRFDELLQIHMLLCVVFPLWKCDCVRFSDRQLSKWSSSDALMVNSDAV